MEAEGAPPAELREVGPYVLLEPLGGGAQGTVYLAEQLHPVRRRVALKLFQHGLADREARVRFEAERHALERMDHGHIAKVLDAGTVQGTEQPYFVMEYVAGEPITTYCDSRRVDVAGRVRLMQQVCDAIQHAHHKGVVHRDLKPGNVLVTEQDGRPMVKVVDFGLARGLDRQLTSQVLVTEEGQLVGTPEYMSPEQAGLSRVDIDARTDIYSLGVLLYELLVGELPFPSVVLRRAGFLEMQRVIREAVPPTPTTRLRQLGARAAEIAERRATTPRNLSRASSGGLGWIAMKCLEKDRNRRYPSPAVLAEDLGRYLDDQPVLAGPPSRVYRFRKWLRRHRTAVATGTAVFIGLVAALAVSLAFYREAEHANALYRRLEDLVLLQELEEREQGLYPELPDEVPRMRAWLADARDLAGRREEHEAALAELELPGGEEASARFVQQHLARLVDELGRLERELIPAVEERVAAALDVEERTVTEPAAPWRAVSEALERDPRFGHGIEPQIGLVPIPEPDPVSGLWEFGHPQTGTVPARGDEGRLEIGEGTGLVFVLLPSGTYWRGAQAEDPDGPNYDPKASPREGPVELVQVGAFFLSKFEMTQAQWKRRKGGNPSLVNSRTWLHYWAMAGLPEDGAARDATVLPVERVSWDECRRTLWQLGLRLPTENEWEYAARAGCGEPWPIGSDPRGIEDLVNLADSLAPRAGIKLPGTLDVEDGFPATAPVDAFAPNAFGLYQMLGNVWEWVRDTYTYRLAPTDRDKRVFRGGSWAQLPDHVRFSTRQAYPKDNRAKDLGVRPARSLDR